MSKSVTQDLFCLWGVCIMASRLDLQSKLEEILGSRNVYFQPPESVKISYPAIVYSRPDIDIKKADDSTYLKTNRYSITVIDRLPDNKAIDALLELPMSSYDRHFNVDNLNHDVITLYF